MVKVVHCKRDKYDVYIGRGSKWGNMYTHKQGTTAKYIMPTREAAVKAYASWIKTQPDLIASLHELKDKTLGCWCAPIDGFQGKLMCHGQVLAALVDGILAEDVP